jgi:hypothetical protein
MQFLKRFAKRVWAILGEPEAEWAVIAGEPAASPVLLLRYAAILALIPALSRFAGASLVGWYAPVLPSLGGAVLIYLWSFALLYVIAFATNLLAPRFGAQKNFASALKLAVYAATPAWLAGIFLIVPGLSFLALFGLYAGYLLWCGLPVLMRAPPRTTLPYAAAVSLVALLAVCALGLATAPLFAPGAPAPSP